MSRVVNAVREHRRIVIGVGIGALVIVLIMGTWASGAFAAERYRTAAAELGSVTSSVAVSGTIDASDRRDVAAAVSGTVSKVAVATGDEVEAGDALVKLDRSDAEKAVRRAEADLASAKLDLSSARTAQTTAVSTASSPSSKSAKSSSSISSEASSSSGAKLPAVKLPKVTVIETAQEAVMTAQTEATTALATASQALEDRNTACQNLDAADATADAACTTALTTVSQAQDAAADAQTALQEAITVLTDVLVDAISGTNSAIAVLQKWVNSQTVSSLGTSKSSANSAKSGSSSTALQGSSGLASSSATSIAAAQAAVDQAQAALTEAEQELDATTILASISGTVTAVDVAVGGSVSAGDTIVTVIGAGGATVSVALTSTKVTEVELGQSAQVLFPGAGTSVLGTVTWVSPVATSSGSPFGGSSSWTALISVSDRDLGAGILPQGARVDVTIDVGSSDDVLTVPTSAVVMGSDLATVRVLNGNTVESKTVELGRIGARLTEIVSGLDAGDHVVLADLRAEIDAAGEVSTLRVTGGRTPSMNGGGTPAGGPLRGGR